MSLEFLTCSTELFCTACPKVSLCSAKQGGGTGTAKQGPNRDTHDVMVLRSLGTQKMSNRGTRVNALGCKDACRNAKQTLTDKAPQTAQA